MIISDIKIHPPYPGHATYNFYNMRHEIYKLCNFINKIYIFREVGSFFEQYYKVYLWLSI